MKHRYIMGLAAAGAMLLAGCDKGGFPGPDRSMYDVVETMTLESSADGVIELNGEKPDEVVLSFTWTPAREMSDDYIVTYVTYLDIEGNDFSNPVREVEEDGVFTKEYTTEQLQTYLVEKWGKNYSRSVNLEFKVIAKWDGGTKYVMPEKRTTVATVRPYRPLTFDADRISLSGEAVTGTSKKVMSKTPENEFIYAEEVYLKAGALTIPIEFEGMTSYICPEEGDVTIPDEEAADQKPVGTTYTACVKDVPKEGESNPAWNIPTEGYWRVIVDIEKKTVKFFSPKNRLEPLTVTFGYEGGTTWMLTKTLRDGMYYLNSMTGWDSWKGKGFNFFVSRTDPQLIIWQGSAFTVSDAFCIKIAQGPKEIDKIEHGPGDGGQDPNANPDGNMTFVSKCLAFVPGTEPGTASSADLELKVGEWLPAAAVVSNRKWKPASATKISKITIDARNNLVRFD
ncbi:MAG: SusE domain-containing protein [Candidatus Cryptobacteroides sp.]